MDNDKWEGNKWKQNEHSKKLFTKQNKQTNNDGIK